jgi:hypothetical protein
VQNGKKKFMKTQKSTLIRNQVAVIVKLQSQENPDAQKIEIAINALKVLDAMPEIKYCEPFMNPKRKEWLQNLKTGDVVRVYEENGTHKFFDEVEKESDRNIWVGGHTIARKFGSQRFGDRLIWIEPVD